MDTLKPGSDNIANDPGVSVAPQHHAWQGTPWPPMVCGVLSTEGAPKSMRGVAAAPGQHGKALLKLVGTSRAILGLGTLPSGDQGAAGSIRCRCGALVLVCSCCRRRTMLCMPCCQLGLPFSPGMGNTLPDFAHS